MKQWAELQPKADHEVRSVFFRWLEQEGRPGAHQEVVLRYNFKRTPNHLKLEFDFSKVCSSPSLIPTLKIGYYNMDF